VQVLYRITFDENFYFIAQSAGPYLWGDTVGAIGTQEVWYLSLEATLDDLPHISQALRFGPDMDPVQLGSDIGVPLVLEIQVNGSLETAEVSIAYEIRETFTEAGMIHGEFTQAIPQQEDLFTYFWLPIAGELDTFALRVLKPLVEIRGQKGTVVSGFSLAPQEIPDSGSLFLPVPMPGTFNWKALHTRYRPLSGVFLATAEHAVLELDQRRFYPFTLDVGLVQGRSPELWLAFSPRPQGWRFRLGIQQQILGLGYLSFEDSPDMPISCLWLPGLEVAYRFPLGPSAESSVVIAAAALGRLGDAEEFFSWGLGSALLSLGYDWEIPRGFTVYAVLGLGFSPKDGFVSGDRDNLVQVHLGRAGYLELPRFSLGVRIPLGKWEKPKAATQ
jgi:hypothetical protein